ncbi:hypothetical protein D9M71_398230 [compost metagenome]
MSRSSLADSEGVVQMAVSTSVRALLQSKLAAKAAGLVRQATIRAGSRRVKAFIGHPCAQKRVRDDKAESTVTAKSRPDERHGYPHFY